VADAHDEHARDLDPDEGRRGRRDRRAEETEERRV
jgi:hypothetical protein